MTGERPEKLPTAAEQEEAMRALLDHVSYGPHPMELDEHGMPLAGDEDEDDE